MRSKSRYRAALCGLSCAAFAGAAAQPASAALFTLVDDNSTAQFDTATSANQFNWFVDGNDRLAQQAFWYRVGNVPESSLHTLPIGVQGTTDANFDGNADTLFVRYNGAGFQVDVRYTLDGGVAGSGASDMGEQISITNLLGTPIDYHFFQYSDFDLGAGGDSLVFTNPNTVRQSGAAASLTETVVTPVPTHHEGAFFPVTLNKLNDGLPTTLSDTPAVGVTLGVGDLTWAYEWDVTIQPGATFQISKDKNLSANIPEPTTAGILMAVGAGLLGRRGTKKRSTK